MSTQTAALIAVALLSALTIFQLLLIAGAPLGRFAWGGNHDVLPQKLRIGSAFSIALYVLFAVVILEEASLTSIIASESVTSIGIWILVVYFALGIIMNAISRSKPERFVMTPVAMALTALFLIVALK